MRNNILPKKLNQEKSTLVKMIDEYYWITITKKLNTKEMMDILLK
jgi:hypothetical protein